MGAYLNKPITEKVSESGEFDTGQRKVIYGATAMQGWRVAMEDAHCIVPDFDGSSSLFGVYDGHGGKEVAVYCAVHLGDIIKSMAAYSEGNLPQAMKDAFMQCDKLLKEDEAIEEMRQYDEDEIPTEEQDNYSKEDLAGLLEESSMPLQDLLARYNAPILLEAAEDKDNSGHVKREGISSILQLLTNCSDLDSESDSDSEQESGISSDESEDGAAEDNNTTTQPHTSNTASARIAADPPSSSTTTTLDTTSTPPLCGQGNTPLPAGNGDTLPGCGQGITPPEKTTPGSRQGNTSPRDTPPPPTGSGREDAPSVHQSSEADSVLECSQASLTPLQSIHDPDQTGDSTVSVKSRTSRETIDASPKINKLESRSLMELLTAKPDIPADGFPTRKRPHPLDDSRNIVKKSPAKKQGYHSGTTAVVGVLRDSEFIVANAGDSKCVLASKGKAVDMSFDHKPTDQIELDRITKAGGKVGADSRVNGGLNLSRAIGDHFYKTNSSLSLEDQMISAMPDIKSVPINDGDQEFIVFACDGIWNSKTSQEVVDFVYCRLKEKVGRAVPTQQHLTEICESLCDACLAADTKNDGTGCDNMTCILIYLSA